MGTMVRFFSEVDEANDAQLPRCGFGTDSYQEYHRPYSYCP